MIVHLFNESRAAHGIMQGLLRKFPNNVVGNIDFVSMGKTVCKKSNDILSDLRKSELIFMSDIDFFHDYFDKEKLWNRVIFYDYRDNLNLIETVPDFVPYFKRSWFSGNERKLKKFSRKIYPISHCALEEYFIEDQEKKYDVGCFFDISNKNLGVRRKNLLINLMKRNFSNSLVGKSTGFANQARISISKKLEGNIFFEFLKIQGMCKVIFTAQPELVDGDNRTWEALCSGGLVFCEKPMIPIKNHLVDNKHCIFFDANSEYSINDAIDKIDYYLNNEECRLKIVKEGLAFVKINHMPINRIEQMLHIKKIFL